MHENILSTIGHTPMVKLSRVLPGIRFNLFAKVESFNPGGSSKDRAALTILRNALEEGQLRPGTTVIESSSGNMGIGLAQACAYFGLHLICVVDPSITEWNLKMLAVYGATIEVVSESDPAGGFLQARLNRVQTLLHSVRDSFWPDQYSNPYNAIAHSQTMHEIVTDMDGQVDYLFCATSTCGTIRGCAEYAREHGLQTKIMAVDAVGSVIFGDKPARRLIPGHGAATRPKLYQADLVDACVHVSDLQCVVGCRRLVQDEAILAGGSSGGVLMAIDQIKEEIPQDAICVAIFPDRGDRYLDTIYSDQWVREHFGEVSHLWQCPKWYSDK